MDLSDRLAGQRIIDYLPRRFRSGVILTMILVGTALGLGLVSAYLIANGNWYLAVGLIFALPGFILLHNYPLVGLAIWLLITPFLMASEGRMFRQLYWVIHRSLPPIMLGIIVVSTMLGVRKRIVPKPGWFELAMVGYIVVTLFSVLMLNADPLATAYQVYDRIIVPMLLYLIIRFLDPNEEDLRRLLPVLLFIALTQAFFGFVYIFARGALPASWLRTDGVRATGSLRAVSVYSTTLLFVGTLLLHSILSGKVGSSKRFLFIGAVFACAVAVFFSFSRASWLGGLAVMGGLFFLYPKVMFKVALIAMPLVLILSGVFLADQLATADHRLNSDQSALGRLPVVLASVEMFKVKPFFGWGYGNFDLYDRQFQGRVGDLVAPEKDHASHNLFLTVLTEQGLTGLALYLAPVIGLLALTIKKWRLLPAEGFWSRKLLGIFWLVIAAHVVVNNFSNMRIVFGLGMWWITLAFIAVIISSATNNSSDRLTMKPLRGLK